MPKSFFVVKGYYLIENWKENACVRRDKGPFDQEKGSYCERYLLILLLILFI